MFITNGRRIVAYFSLFFFFSHLVFQLDEDHYIVGTYQQQESRVKCPNRKKKKKRVKEQKGECKKKKNVIERIKKS